MSTNAPQKSQDTSTQKEPTASREQGVGKEQTAGREQNVGRDQSENPEQNAGREQNVGRDQNYGRDQNADREREREQNAAKEIKQEMTNTAQSMRDLVKEIGRVATKGGEEIFRIQSDAVVEALSDSLSGFTSPISSKSPMSMLIWDFPNRYQAQSDRMVKTLIDSLSMMARIQQQQLELLGPTLHRNIESTTNTMTKISGVLASRRERAAKVIDFADRRATSMAQQQQQSRDEQQSRARQQAYAESEAERGQGGTQRSNRQAAG